MNTLQNDINELIAYGLQTGLIVSPDDIDYIINRLRDLLELVDFDYQKQPVTRPLHDILAHLLEHAISTGLISDTIDDRDIFDTEIMDALTPMPSTVIQTFNHFKTPQEATDFYYNFSKNTNYIRTDRIKKDKKWKVDTSYGTLDITINLSKPEKDPKAIAAARNVVSSNYPKCLLCKENVGNSGNAKQPARNNHRVIPLQIQDEDWFLQYSPYVYYNEHCIVIKSQHEPMSITETTFKRLLDFVTHYPHYFVGSNADLPIVGGSILSHEHFQGGNYTFAMNHARVLKTYPLENGRVSLDILQWPLTTLRLRTADKNPIDLLAKIANNLLVSFRSYSDEANGIFAFTGDTPHNTITPIARYNADSGEYELDLVLRNNRTSNEHPDGIYHPHAHLHHLKKENIGLIEVLGLAILPTRLLAELQLVKSALLARDSILLDAAGLQKHTPWVNELLAKYEIITEENADSIIENEVGHKFIEILECCGIYKLDNKTHLTALQKFIEHTLSL